MFADGGVDPVHGPDTTRLYFPADQHQFAACVKQIFHDPGLRFLFSTRATVPDILDVEGKPLYLNQPFEPGKDHLFARPGGQRLCRGLGKGISGARRNHRRRIADCTSIS